MANDSIKQSAACRLAARPEPDDLHPLDEFTLTVEAACEPPHALGGHEVVVHDHQHHEVARNAFPGDGGTSRATTHLQMSAPAEVGSYRWTCKVPTASGAVGGVAEASFGFEVKPHDTHIVVWGAPAVVPAGEVFSLMVGIRTSAKILLEDKEFFITDQDGRVVATGALGSRPWKETEALAFAEIELEAPASPGEYMWAVKTHASNGPIPHSAAEKALRLRVVQKPDVRIRVKAVDQDNALPIEGLTVLMHPFRATTNAEGDAVLDVPRGSYTLHVSGKRYFPYREKVDAQRDDAIRAVLEFEKIGERVR